MNLTVIRIILFILFVLIFLSLLVWATLNSRKQVSKDWDTLKELKQKASSISTKEEIEIFHKEFVEKANKINNQYIHLELQRINGYLQGLYKQYKT